MNLTESILIVSIINFISAFTQASTGFGYAIVAMFLMPWFIPYKECSIISAAVIIIIAAQMTYSLRKSIRIKKIIWPMAGCISTIWIGIYIIDAFDVLILRRIMGVLLVFLAIFFLVVKKYQIKINETIFRSLVIGMLTGLSTGMFNIVGPFFSFYYYDNVESALEFKANLEFSFLIAGITSLLLNLRTSHLKAEIIPMIFISGFAAIIAGNMGLRIYSKINKNILKHFIFAVMLMIGLIQLSR